MRFVFLSLFVLTISGIHCSAQDITGIDPALYSFECFSTLLSPEKVYLHTDKQVYCTGEYIWFNAYLTNNSCFSLLPESNYIYAELIHKDTVLSRVKIKRCIEGFPGENPFTDRFAIGKIYFTGIYSLDAKLSRNIYVSQRNYPCQPFGCKKRQSHRAGI